MSNRISKIISDEWLNQGIQIESAGNPDAGAGTSSAAGLGQFIVGTWDAVGRKHFPAEREAAGSRWASMRRGRATSDLQVRMMAAFWEDNYRALGGSPTAGDMYLAHFLGVGDAKRVMTAPQGDLASDHVSPGATKANTGIISGKTCGQLRQWAAQSMANRWARAGRKDWVGIWSHAHEDLGANVPVPPSDPVRLPVPSNVPTTKEDAKQVGWLSSVIAALTAAFSAVWGSWAFKILIVLIPLALLYWFVVRPILVRYWALGDIEATYLSKIRVAAKGMKTKVLAWLVGLLGAIVPVVSMFQDAPISSLLPTVYGVSGETYWPFLVGGFMALSSWLFKLTRDAATAPVGVTDMALLQTPSLSQTSSPLDDDNSTLALPEPKLPKSRKRRRK